MSTTPEPVLSVQSLSKYFRYKSSGADNPIAAKEGDGFWALKNVSFSLGKGEVLGIIGRNGAGKSTLLKILAGILKPTEGKVSITGNTAAIFEAGAGFHPDLKGRENIFFYGTLLGIEKEYLKKSVEDIIDFSGIRPFIDMPVKYYSSGMYLRLAAAIAFHVKVDLLLLDEILFVGDLEFKMKCLQKVQGMISSGATVILVSHNINDVLQFSSSCLWLDKGEVKVLDAPGRVIAKYVGSSLYTDSAANDALQKNGSLPSGISWPDKNTAPGSGQMKLREITVAAAGKAKGENITVKDDITVEIAFEKLKPGYSVQLHIVFFDQLMNPAFSTDTFFVKGEEDISGRFKNDAGLFVLRCMLPGNFLYKGNYTFQLRFGTDMTKEDFIYNSEVSLVIHADENSADYIGDALPIAVRPLFYWEYEKIPAGK